MGFQRDLPRVVLLAALSPALLPGAALAAPAWLAPETLAGSGSESGAPDVTAFGDGGAAVVWTAFSAVTDGKGSFRTTGRHAAATVRGTRWLVEDRCDGTLVRVRRGRVEVRDLRRARSVLVGAGHSYLARLR